MNYKAKIWYKKLNDLEEKVSFEDAPPRDEQIKWVADCVAVFSSLGVNAEIIKCFMKFFEVGLYTIRDSSSDQGPYTQYTQWAARGGQDRITGFFHINIAFITARALVQKIEAEEQLVQRTLIDYLRNDDKYAYLADSLESMESAYQSKNAPNLLSSSQSLLSSLINLHNNVKEKSKRKSIKKQLEYIIKNEEILKDYGVNKELMEVFLNILRPLRNKVGEHKEEWSKKPPVFVSYGLASLVLLLLYGIMAKGVLIKTPTKHSS